LPHFDVSLDVFLELVHVLLELGGQGNLRDGARDYRHRRRRSGGDATE
jgi:hypothetical protein